MRKIDTIVIHCTATPEGKEFSLAQITAMHRARGFKTCGYHILVHLDGSVSIGRPDEMVGAHVAGFNATTLAASYVGGLSKSGQAKDTRTPAQKKTLIEVVKAWNAKHPEIYRVLGHRDLSPDLNKDGRITPDEWMKQCPCFDAIPEYSHLLKGGK